MKNFLGEFRAFISRGNVMDMAVGVIIGGAFTAIVNSLVGDIIQPLISGITGGGEQIGLVVNVGAAQLDFGAFISAVINFIIIAFIIFCLVKSMNKLAEEAKKLAGKQEKEEEAAVPICPARARWVRSNSRRWRALTGAVTPSGRC